MNKKELLETEMSRYNFYRGSYISFFGLAFIFFLYSVILFICNLHYASAIFSTLTLMLLILMIFSIYQSGRLNLKWKAEYKLINLKWKAEYKLKEGKK